MTEEEKVGYRSFREKLQGDTKYIGFYALPYDYVRDLQKNWKEIGYKYTKLNYGSFYANYNEVQNSFSVVNAPFSCKDSLAYGSDLDFPSYEHEVAKRSLNDYKLGMELIKSDDRYDRSEGKEIVRKVLLSNSIGTRLDATFKVAKLATHVDGRDNVAKLYNGDFNKFYCYPSNNLGEIGTVWPSKSQIPADLNNAIYERFNPTHRDVYAWRVFFDEMITAGLAD